jgi:hypothetical protein
MTTPLRELRRLTRMRLAEDRVVARFDLAALRAIFEGRKRPNKLLLSPRPVGDVAAV